MNFNRYGILLKKHLYDGIPSVMRKKNRTYNWAGIVLSVVLAACLISAFVFIFSRFVQTYCAIKINRVEDIPARQYEIMSCAYFILTVAMVVSSVNRLCYTLFENSDIKVLITMPFSSSEIFLSRMTALYLKQVIYTTVCVLCINLTFFIGTHTVNAYNVLMSFVVGIALPIIPLSIASVIVLPYYYIKRAMHSHYILIFLMITAIMVVFCLCYSYVFDFAQSLLNSGKISSFFNERVMHRIQNFAAYCYPANLFASLMLSRDVGKTIGLLAAILIVCATAGYFIVRTIFIRVSQTNFATRVPHHTHKSPIYKKRSGMHSLLAKEFLLVLRTPGYSYMYFTTAIIMPVLAFYSAEMSESLVQTLLGNINPSFELCTFILLLYSTLTNTFCSTNISRDGYMSMTLKTLPYTAGRLMQSKIIFCAIVSELSIFAAVTVFAAFGLETPADAVASFVSASLLSFAQIIFATKLDLKHPSFAKIDDGEIKETNSTVSAVIATGLAVSFVIGILLLYNTVIKWLIAGGAPEQINSGAASYAIALCLPLAVLAAAIAYYVKGLKDAYANLDAEV